MRIAILGRNIEPPWNEAVKNMAFELATKLAASSHKVHLLTTGSSLASDHEVIIHSLPFRDFWRSAVKTLLEIEAEDNLDLVHVQNLIIHRSFAPFLGVLRRRSRLPVVAYCCQLPSISFPIWVKVLRKDPREALSTKLGMLAPSLMTQWTIRTIDRTIASSRFIRTELADSQPHQPIEIIRPFFNSNRLTASRTMKVDRSDGRRVLYLGSHKVLRGEDDFLSMLGLLRKDYPNLEGIAVTPHPVPRRIQRLVKAWKLERSVKFLPRNVDMDVPSLIKSADLYVFTGLSPIGSIDPPLSVIESLILGTPVVSYNTGGIEEILDKQNLARYQDYVSLARIARRFLDGRPNAEPRPELLSEFSSQAATKRFEELYQKFA